MDIPLRERHGSFVDTSLIAILHTICNSAIMSQRATSPVGSEQRLPLGSFGLQPEDVFEGDTPDDLRCHISILSIALTRCGYGEPTSSRLPKDVPGNSRRMYNLLRHISTLLTIGTPRDYTAASVNAVTGLIEQDRVSSIIATTNTRPRNGDPQLVQRAELLPIHIGDAAQARNLLYNWPVTG